jgi:hypothetical protein
MTPVGRARRLSLQTAPNKNPTGIACRRGGRGTASAPGAIRTRDLWLRRPTLYPAELRALNEWEANKPSSVSVNCVLAHATGGGSFLWDYGLPQPRAAYPGLDWRGPRLVPYLALLRVGFTEPLTVTRSAVVSYTAVSPLPDPLARPSAVCSLLHFPSPRDARPLAGTLPCGARTFLGAGPQARDAIHTRFPFCQTATRPSGLEPETS